MARNGRRYRLVLYTRVLNHWWKLTLVIGFILLALAACMGILPIQLPSFLSISVPEMAGWFFAGAGVYALLLTLFLLAIRNMAYVQPCSNHLRLVTPFIQFNISFRRIRQATSVEIQHLFPLAKFRGWREKLIFPVAGKTAIVLEMQGWPLPRWVMNQFLSPFFFPGKNPRLALLVPNWMEFSTELESFRSAWRDSQRSPGGLA
jgi:hypothetical protein